LAPNFEKNLSKPIRNHCNFYRIFGNFEIRSIVQPTP
jgi:hypothetical protein